MSQVRSWNPSQEKPQFYIWSISNIPRQLLQNFFSEIAMIHKLFDIESYLFSIEDQK
jgi:hypothetical protein